jgi:hypothetical protein
MIFILVESPNTLAINEEDLELFSLIFALESVSPKPQALGARIYCWTHIESLMSLINYDSVQ